MSTITIIIEKMMILADNDIVTLCYGGAAFIGLCVIAMFRQSLKNASHKSYCR